jgi:ABC-type branched-subunit amino acid transport system substrate-binding protein
LANQILLYWRAIPITWGKIMQTSLIRSICGAILAIFALAAHAETGVTDNTVLIGQSAAFSGPAQELGLEMRQGAKLVFDSVNAQGGIYGRKLQLVAHDDGYEPERAAANTRKLINEDRIFALFGYVGTPTSQASLPIFTEARVPFIGAFTGAQLLREPFNRYIFNVRASYFDETEKSSSSWCRWAPRPLPSSIRTMPMARPAWQAWNAPSPSAT